MQAKGVCLYACGVWCDVCVCVGKAKIVKAHLQFILLLFILLLFILLLVVCVCCNFSVFFSKGVYPNIEVSFFCPFSYTFI